MLMTIYECNFFVYILLVGFLSSIVRVLLAFTKKKPCIYDK